MFKKDKLRSTYTTAMYGLIVWAGTGMVYSLSVLG